MDRKLRGLCPACGTRIELSPLMEIPSHAPAPSVGFEIYDEDVEDGNAVLSLRIGESNSEECAGVGQIVPPLRETERERFEREGLNLLCPDGHCTSCNCPQEQHYLVTYDHEPISDFVCKTCTANHEKPAALKSGDSIIISLAPQYPLPACMIVEMRHDR